jgi:hypothetical protein
VDAQQILDIEVVETISRGVTVYQEPSLSASL